MLKRVLIANRGEIAVRVIKACREMGIESVAVYSDADANAVHTRAADRAIAIGPPSPAASYLAISTIVEAARSARADAVHPGYGFLSENAAFARACTDAGITFIGPPADVIARMGSKIEARALVSAAGVPVVPGETPSDQSDDGIQQAVDRVGLPALIKASAGGGGKGMRRVRERGEVLEAIQAARREATAAFRDGTLYVEKLIEAPHHVEVQIFADAHGHTIHLFERDCSVQRRHQKVIEESPAPILTPDLRDQMTRAAVAAARAAGYRNAGTIEFLVDPASGAFYFLEMNTRLQVEHPVTEQVTGLDLVRAQLLVAAGEPLPWAQDAVAQRGHAIEARVYAEDPSQGFIPQAGRLDCYREPRWPGVRVDSGVAQGSEVSVYYDPMIAKVIATAESRPLAINRLAAALRTFDIGPVRTNIALLIHVLELNEFRAGTIDTAFLDRESPRLAKLLSRESSVDYQARGDDQAPSNASPDHQSPQSPIPNPQSPIPDPKSPIPDPQSPSRWDPWSGTTTSKAATDSPTRQRSRKAAGGSALALTAPMPATVLKLKAAAGDVVKKGDVIVLLEAMKMELPLRAPADAKIAAVNCHEGEMVEGDAVLVEFAKSEV